MSTDSPPRTSLQDFIDSAPLSRRQRMIVLLLMIVMLAEGMDYTVIAQIFPRLIQEWGTPVSTITTIVVASSVTVGIGSIVAGPLAYRLGRKNVVIASVAVFSVCTAAIGLAPSIEVFMLFRIVSCLGIGAIVVCGMTAVADLVPKPRRAQMMTLAFTGVNLGGIVGGFLAAAIIPKAGWPMLAMVAGAVGLVLIPFIVAVIPESPQMLIARGKSPELIRKSLGIVVPGRDSSDVELALPKTETGDKKNLGALFVRRLLPQTMVIWFLYLMVYGVHTIVLQYLPTLLQQPTPGFTPAQSGLAFVTLCVGGLIGGVVTSFVLKRADQFFTLAVVFAGVVTFALVIGLAGFNVTGYFTVLFLFGMFVFVPGTVIGAIVVQIYPATLRDPGMGAAMGAGRVGQLLGGLAGGVMIGAGFGLSGVFIALSLPIILAIATVLGLRGLSRRHQVEDRMPEHITT
ncbi:hypothetical protein DM793_03685 [Paenarthrobacter nitroguajacolicus]|uniref:MFS transporter n=1 Tax=Paenarthrobacter nitroguajacolicus TaxID=211146 RepID=UPI0015B89449|nr:MFS transporter [Paenarthrobacter nitroguajacolicus]NWL10405.1 hypothetical protein [Paenarthrobacter nitroguajacolicus]